jgi:hypothetical protein
MRQVLFAMFLSAPLLPVAAADLVVHEWGTITTIHSASGQPHGGLNRIDASDVLPDFVHRYEPEQTGQDPAKAFGKSPLVPGRPDVTMRLETPVIYFHPPAGVGDGGRCDRAADQAAREYGRTAHPRRRR